MKPHGLNQAKNLSPNFSDFMTAEWRLLNLSELPWMRSQSIYHAVSLVQDKLKTPNTLIITWPDQPFVCIGLHQIIDQSVELEYLVKNNIPYIRRATGGGSVYLDSNQLFYQIICRTEDYPESTAEFYKRFLEPVVQTYRSFSIPAEYSPINDIVANGRKISGNGAVTFGSSRVLVGNFIFDFPAQEMSKILKVPEEKFRDKIAKSLQERMGSFTYFLEENPKKEEVIERYLKNFEKILGINIYHGNLIKEEQKKLSELEQLYMEKEWMNYVEKSGDEIFQQKIKSGTYFTLGNKKFQGGLVQIFLNSENNKIKEILISGDFTISPPYILKELEHHLQGMKIDEETLTKTIIDFYSKHSVESPGILAKEISGLIADIFRKTRK